MKAVKCNGFSATFYSRNLRRKRLSAGGTFCAYPRVSEGVSLMASFWLQVEIGHLGPTPGLDKIAVSKNPQQSCDPTTLHLNRSLSARGNSSTFAFADPVSVLAPSCFSHLSRSGLDVPPALSCWVFMSLVSTASIWEEQWMREILNIYPYLKRITVFQKHLQEFCCKMLCKIS